MASCKNDFLCTLSSNTSKLVISPSRTNYCHSYSWNVFCLRCCESNSLSNFKCLAAKHVMSGTLSEHVFLSCVHTWIQPTVLIINIIVIFIISLTTLKHVKKELSIRKLSNFNFQRTKTLYQNKLNSIAFFFTLFKGYRTNQLFVIIPKKISFESPRK